MKKQKPFFVLFFYLFINISNGQNKSFINGFGIEIGGGYNTMRYCIKEIKEPHDKNIFKSNSFWVQPSYKIYYTFKINNINKFEISPFLGFYNYGGKSKTASNGYKAILLFKSVETGICPTFKIQDKIEVSPALKGQYNFSVIKRLYDVKGPTDTITKLWQNEDWSKIYNKFSANAGIKVTYKLFYKFHIGADAWFGISSLLHYDGFEYKYLYTENNYRLFLGYEF